MSVYSSLKRSLLEGYASSNLTINEILICILVTMILSAFLFLFYQYMNRNSFYNKNFNLSLPALAILTAAIILTVQTNIVISLGMVGALSIVRFRTAIKDPMDLVFLFWAIGIGIICGAGIAIVAIIASAVIAIVLTGLNHLPATKAAAILVINADDYECEEEILKIVAKYCRRYDIKSRNLVGQGMDMAIEVKTNSDADMLRELSKINNVHGVSLVAHGGEVTF